MSTRVFFYGMYMDAGLLRSMGFSPVVIGKAKLVGYQLKIGKRATVVPAPDSVVLGFLLDLPEQEATALYARPEVAGYAPQAVVATLLEDGSSHPASCYVLQDSEPDSRTNREYVERLAELVTQLGLPASYSREIRALSGEG